MQTYKDGEIQNFEMAEKSEDLASLFNKQMDEGKADQAVIAKMAEVGEEVKIRGISFTVKQVTKSGNVVLEPNGSKSS